MFLSVFELFKVGIGPSSSHTMGPMVAARRFLDEILTGDWPRRPDDRVAHLRVALHGSLAFTGKGHATDRAVILGLAGEEPDRIDPDRIEPLLEKIGQEKAVSPAGHPAYGFDPERDLIFDYETQLPGHTNGMTFWAHASDGRMLLKREYYSIGGGFVVDGDELQSMGSGGDAATHSVPYPFENAREMLDMAAKSGLSIAQMKRENEQVISGPEDLSERLHGLWDVMRKCVDRGMQQEGILPGGLRVKRRAKQIHEKLLEERKSNRPNPLAANDWLQLYAMAVNEENAAGGKVVTAPTNGAAGVVPAVICYYRKFMLESDEAAWGEDEKEATEEFLLTAAAIGGIIKHNASISGAEVGCQGEVGSAAAMAAAGLAAVMGGTPAQVENAAEIALEHHLGMTCDPISGLVQVPCIERNGIGAIKAVSAASLALKGDGSHLVPLDACIKTMLDTGHDMNARYKETSQGGLAVNVVEC